MFVVRSLNSCKYLTKDCGPSASTSFRRTLPYGMIRIVCRLGLWILLKKGSLVVWLSIEEFSPQQSSWNMKSSALLASLACDWRKLNKFCWNSTEPLPSIESPSLSNIFSKPAVYDADLCHELAEVVTIRRILYGRSQHLHIESCKL